MICVEADVALTELIGVTNADVDDEGIVSEEMSCCGKVRAVVAVDVACGMGVMPHSASHVVLSTVLLDLDGEGVVAEQAHSMMSNPRVGNN